jgi:hypothetical protein
MKKGTEDQLTFDSKPIGIPWQTKGIFTDHYLRHHLPKVEDWPLDIACESAYQKCRELVESRQTYLGKFDEYNTRQDLIDPLLTLLGFRFSGEEPLPGKFKEKPDYILFANDDQRSAAFAAEPRNLYAFAISLCEAKKYDHNLGEVSHRDTPGRFPHQQVADYLRNAIDASIRKPYFNWAILTNGGEWRLYHRLSHSYSFFSFDLEQGVLSREYFKYFWLLFNVDSFIQDENGNCRLDRILDSALQRSTELESDLRSRVYHLLERLANGFFHRKGNKIGTSPEELKELYDSSLIYFYRLLFILYAEGRDLLPVGAHRFGSNNEYREKYSLKRLRGMIQTVNREDEPLVRIYNELGELFDLIDGDDPDFNKRLNVPPYNGGLFSSGDTPRLKQWKVGNFTLSEVLKGLMFTSIVENEGETVEVKFEEAIDYGDLEVRQLGSIYEGLLDHHLELLPSGRLKLVAEDKSTKQWTKRRETGSYYTPDYIVKYIIKQTLQPLIDEISKRPDVRAAVDKQLNDNSFAEHILGLKILDPAMGSGHFLVRATEKLADEIAHHPTTRLAVTEVKYGLSHEFAEIAYWRRRVVESCIYGVDLNPLAVELGKLSLWLTCISSTDPLSFLDHHIKCGNSLVGSKIADLDHLRRAKEATAALLNVSGLEEACNEAIEYLALIRSKPSDSIDIVREKEAIWKEEVVKRLAPFMAVADLRTGFDLGFKLENVEYAHMASALLSDPSDLHDDLKTQKDALHFLHWELAFPEVFPAGGIQGFDAIIGNPPYVRSAGIGEIKSYLADGFVTYNGNADLYTYFIEKSFSLLRLHGHFGFIISNKWLKADYGENLRHFLRTRQIYRLVDISQLAVFEEATSYPLILIAQNCEPNAPTAYSSISAIPENDEELERDAKQVAYDLGKEAFFGNGFTLVKLDIQSILNKMREAGKPIAQVIGNNIHYGIKTGLNRAFIIDKRKRADLIKTDPASAELIVPFVMGEDVRKYQINYRDRYLILALRGMSIDNYVGIKTYLGKMKPNLMPKKSRLEITGRKPGDYEWYELQDVVAYHAEFLKPKIVWPVITMASRFTFDTSGYYLNDKCFFFPSENLALLGILNSKAAWIFFKSICSPLMGDHIELRKIYVQKLPIPVGIDHHADQLSSNVRQRIELADELREASNLPLRKKMEIEDKIVEVEREIDMQVYQLYGLTDKEIEIIEGGK